MSRKAEPVFDNDNPEWTEADFARATRFPEGLALKDFKPSMLKRGRPKLESPKEAIKLRLDADILASYRATGAGWQSRINADLRKVRKLKTG